MVETISISPILQSIAENIKYNELPEEWNSFDLETYSSSIKLWDFQQKALQNSIKGLYLYYEKLNASKQNFWNLYKPYLLNLKNPSLFDLNFSKVEFELLQHIKVSFNSDGDSLEFSNLINRQAFWMATGSGKSLIIIKLIEVIYHLIARKLIPKKDFLFLTHREDLIDQFKEHVDAFNEMAYSRGVLIRLRPLPEYEATKRESVLPILNTVNVFYYRSDLIREEQKESIIDFRTYENSGNWYVFLDEAHKGDREESKRKLIFCILSRAGFLFNFSATFVDNSDIITTIYNFNLEKFINQGYGKKIMIFRKDIDSFHSNQPTDLDNENQKTKTVLKSLILLTYLKKRKEQLAKINPNLYHAPLMVTLVNSVNFSELKEEESDLKLFFNEIERIAKGSIPTNLLNEACSDLISDLHNTPYLFRNDQEDKLKIERSELSTISNTDILKYIFNTDTFGTIEGIINHENNKELILKLKTAEKPFGIIKIGDIKKWIEENIPTYELAESYEDKKIFKNLELQEDITILLGSRAFYEGWDSKRPNIIMFINIGKGQESKKFITQSIGRGIRIQSLPNTRKRLHFIFNQMHYNGIQDILQKKPISQQTNMKNISKSIQSLKKEDYQPLETLYIFGTKAQILTEIVNTLKITQDEQQELQLNKNPLAENLILYIPTYKTHDKPIWDKDGQKFNISEQALSFITTMLQNIDPRILMLQYDLSIQQFYSLNSMIQPSSIQNSFNIIKRQDLIKEKSIDITIRKMKHFLATQALRVNNFKRLQEEIIHFKKIMISFSDTKEKQEFYEKLNKVATNLTNKENYKDLTIQNLINHFYNPTISSISDKIAYITHIIKIPGEVDFIESLKQLLTIYSFDPSIEYWMFSKIDEHVDDVKIPYFHHEKNEYQNFYPDFIFWIKKQKKFQIVFVDPKGSTHTDYIMKIQGYQALFQENNIAKIFKQDGLEISVHLFMYNKNILTIPQELKIWWIENPKTIFEL